jgi:four helix bundle protein
MNPDELKSRTKKLSLEIIHIVETLPITRSANAIVNQLLRSGTSVGANYRAAYRARSRADFASKAGIAIEEADETMYWMELLCESGLVPKERLSVLIEEANELISILTASVITARANLKK